MQPRGSSNPHANATTPGRYGNGGGGGFRDGRGQPYHPPAAQEVTPQEKEEVLMAAGRLAAEYLVSRGDLPPDVLDNRPPPPLPPSHQPPRGFHFQGRPPAPPQQQHRQFQWELRPYEPQRRQPWHRPFRGGRGGGPGPFPKQPHYAAARPYPYGGGARGPAPAKLGYNAGQGATTARNVREDNGHSAPAGDASESLPTAQPANGVTPSAAQQTNQPSSSSLGANDSK